MNKKLSRMLSSVLAFAMIVSCLTVVNVSSVFAETVTEQWDATKNVTFTDSVGSTTYPSWFSSSGSLTLTEKAITNSGASGTMAEAIFGDEDTYTVRNQPALVTGDSGDIITVTVTGDATFKLYAVRNSTSTTYFNAIRTTATNGTTNLSTGSSGTLIQGRTTADVEAITISLTATDDTQTSTYNFSWNNSAVCIFRMELTYTATSTTPTLTVSNEDDAKGTVAVTGTLSGGSTEDANTSDISSYTSLTVSVTSADYTPSVNGTALSDPASNVYTTTIAADDNDSTATFTDDVTIVVTYVKTNCTVTYESAYTGGTVSVTDVASGSTVTGGSTITITATPAEGYELTSITAGTTVFTESPASYTVTDDVTITAEFTASATTVTATVTDSAVTFPNDGVLTTDTGEAAYASDDSSTNNVTISSGSATLVDQGSDTTSLTINLTDTISSLGEDKKVTFSGTMSNFVSPGGRWSPIAFRNGTTTIAAIRANSTSGTTDYGTSTASDYFCLAIPASSGFTYYAAGTIERTDPGTITYSITFDYANDTITLDLNGSTAEATVSSLSTVDNLYCVTAGSASREFTLSAITITTADSEAAAETETVIATLNVTGSDTSGSAVSSYTITDSNGDTVENTGTENEYVLTVGNSYKISADDYDTEELIPESGKTSYDIELTKTGSSGTVTGGTAITAGDGSTSLGISSLTVGSSYAAGALDTYFTISGGTYDVKTDEQSYGNKSYTQALVTKGSGRYISFTTDEAALVQVIFRNPSSKTTESRTCYVKDSSDTTKGEISAYPGDYAVSLIAVLDGADTYTISGDNSLNILSINVFVGAELTTTTSTEVAGAYTNGTNSYILIPVTDNQVNNDDTLYVYGSYGAEIANTEYVYAYVGVDNFIFAPTDVYTSADYIYGIGLSGTETDAASRIQSDVTTSFVANE